jgi:exonuclease SbcC
MVHERALELLAGACRDISQRFNRAVGSLAGTLLPSLTDNRYEHLEIDESFDVRLFSNEKRDFMDLDEISSGTQRQVMLGLRLALSQALIRTAIGGRQFIFLDEPFAFFDAQRMRGALAAVRILSVDIPQIFIIAQEFPEGSTLDKHIVCKREAQDIFVDAASAIKVSEA